MHALRNIEERSHNRCYREKAISIKYYACILALAGIQSACTVLCCHLCPVWLYHIFPHYLINSTILRKKLIIM